MNTVIGALVFAFLLGVAKAVAITFLLSLLVPQLIAFTAYNVVLILLIYVVVTSSIKFEVS